MKRNFVWAVTGYVTWDFWDGLYKKFYLNLPNFVSIYGRGSYALITGGSDGIGKGFAEVLASKGMNLILVSRSQSNLEKLKSELEQKYKVQVLIHSLDLSQASESDFQKLQSKTSKVDISMLINCAGQMNLKKVTDFSHQEIEKIVSLNCSSVVHMMNLYLPQLSKRDYRSAVINLGSSMAVSPVPYCSLYSSTKVFNHYMSLGSSEEFRNHVDFLSFMPSTVTTPGTGYDKSWRAESPEDVVVAALKDLGRKRVSYGTLKHTCICLLSKLIPDSVLLNLLYGKIENIVKSREKAAGNK
jgi:17beta-estradiol 17-dehydrogenase / very-long-chain 3-oxoacyl-CoA reductase